MAPSGPSTDALIPEPPTSTASVLRGVGACGRVRVRAWAEAALRVDAWPPLFALPASGGGVSIGSAPRVGIGGRGGGLLPHSGSRRHECGKETTEQSPCVAAPASVISKRA